MHYPSEVEILRVLVFWIMREVEISNDNPRFVYRDSNVYMLAHGGREVSHHVTWGVDVPEREERGSHLC